MDINLGRSSLTKDGNAPGGDLSPDDPNSCAAVVSEAVLCHRQGVYLPVEKDFSLFSFCAMLGINNCVFRQFQEFNEVRRIFPAAASADRLHRAFEEKVGAEAGLERSSTQPTKVVASQKVVFDRHVSHIRPPVSGSMFCGAPIQGAY